jgi:hypothetical protein
MRSERRAGSRHAPRSFLRAHSTSPQIVDLDRSKYLKAAQALVDLAEKAPG